MTFTGIELTFYLMFGWTDGRTSYEKIFWLGIIGLIFAEDRYA